MSFDEEIDWDIRVFDEYCPYNVSLLFCLVVNVFLVTCNNPTIPSLPLDMVLDPTRRKISSFAVKENHYGKITFTFTT